jgi:hypothetical protein
MILATELLNVLNAKRIKLALDDEANLIIRGDKSRLTADLIGSIKQLKPELVALLQQNKATKQSLLIEPLGHQAQPALSFAQQRLWLLDQIDQGSSHYNMPHALKLSGALNVAALGEAFSAIVERHQSLRTCFLVDDQGQLYQQLQPSSITLEVEDLTALSTTQQQAAVAEQMAFETSQPFDLAADLMIRTRLLKLSVDEHVLLLTLHHIAFDGQSMAILMSELSALYLGIKSGGEQLAPLPVQYGDYAHWQRQWLQGEQLSRQLDYWQQQLADLPMVHNLPLDYPRPERQGFEGQEFASQFDSDTTQALSQLCRPNRRLFSSACRPPLRCCYHG